MSDTISAAESVSSGPSDDIGALIDAIEGGDDASSASSPEAPADTPAEAPTEPTAAPVANHAPPTTEGPIPFDRHKEILERARAESEARIRAKLGWAERYDPTTTEQGVRLLQWLQADPAAFYQYLGAQLPKQAPEESIEPLLKAEDGTAAYSAEQVQKLLERQEAKLWQKVEQEYGPVKQKEQTRELHAQVDQQAKSYVAQMRTWPMFEQHERDIKALLVSDPTLQPLDAYFKVLREKALPSVETKIRSQYEGVLKDKAAAVTTRPGPQAATPVSFKGMSTHDIAALTLDELEGRRS